MADATVKLVEMCERAFRQRDELALLLHRYVSAYPAFRIKPIGAEGSPARVEQEMLMSLEDSAREALARLVSTQGIDANG